MDNKKIDWDILYQAVMEVDKSRIMTKKKTIVYIIAWIVEIIIFVLIWIYKTELALFLGSIITIIVLCVMCILFIILD